MLAAMLAGRSKSVFISQGKIIAQIESVIVGLPRAGIIKGCILFQIFLEESEHLVPGLTLDAAGSNGFHIGDKGVGLTFVNADFMRDGSLV